MLKIIFLSLVVLLLQLLLSELLSINQVSPDFLLIFVIYSTFIYGRLKGLVIGFFIGLISDLVGVSSYFGLYPLLLSSGSYSISFLIGRYEKVLPYIFHSIWLLIVMIYFFIMTYVKYYSLFISDFSGFLLQAFYFFLYTFSFLIIFQYFYSIKEASHAEET